MVAEEEEVEEAPPRARHACRVVTVVVPKQLKCTGSIAPGLQLSSSTVVGVHRS